MTAVIIDVAIGLTSVVLLILIAWLITSWILSKIDGGET